MSKPRGVVRAFRDTKLTGTWNTCVECGERFSATLSQRLRITCSVDCSDDRERRRQRLKQYGLTLHQYDEIYERQQGRCAVCGEPEIEGRKRLAVDHDHSCCKGKRSCGDCVRGLLCGRCNGGLGQFRDEPMLLRAALAYLECHARPVVPHVVDDDWGSAWLEEAV